MLASYKNIKNKLKALFVITLATASFPSMAYYGGVMGMQLDPQFNLKLGGWSEHLEESYDKYDYNESHNGFGFDWSLLRSRNGKHSLGLGYFQMKDSFSMDSIQAGMIYTYTNRSRYPIIRDIDLNMSVSVLRRGWIVREDEDYNKYNLEYRTIIAPLPYLTYNVGRYFNVDVFYIPQFDGDMPKGTWFIRGGINLSQMMRGRRFHF